MKYKNEKGFTLIEIMMTIGIMALGYSAVLFFGLGSKSQLRQETRNLVNKIRYLYQLAATESRYYRIVFDLDAGQYRFDVSDDPIFVRTETEDDDSYFKKDKDTDTEAAAEDDTAQVAEGFVETEDDMLDPYVMDEGIKIYSIYVEHQKESVVLGTAELNFFPRGQTEFAVIQLSDKDETQFVTIQVNPTSGAVEVFDELKDYQSILEGLKE